MKKRAQLRLPNSIEHFIYSSVITEIMYQQVLKGIEIPDIDFH